MHRKFGQTSSFLTIALAVALFSTGVVAGNVLQQQTAETATKKMSGAQNNYSQERISFINGLILEYIRNGEDIDDQDVRSAIYNDISKVMPLKPLGKAKVYSFHELAERVNAIVEREYTASSSEVEAKAEREADQKFKMAPLRDDILVEYRKGPYSYKYRGTLYSTNPKMFKLMICTYSTQI